MPETGYRTATAAASISVTGSDSVWSSATNARVSDNGYASVSLSTNAWARALIVSNFGFSVPDNALGLTITAEVEIKSSAAAPVSVYLAPTVDQNVSVGYANSLTSLPNMDTVYTVANTTSGWGQPDLTPAMINSAGFGFILRARNLDTTTRTVTVDAIRLNISWVDPASGNPFLGFF